MIPAGDRLHRKETAGSHTLFTQTWSIADGH
jgi:hypothetical protein